jgi:large subunit ribosomal protein L23
MGIFNFAKKNKITRKAPADVSSGSLKGLAAPALVKAAVAPSDGHTFAHPSAVLVRPRITEKATMLASGNVYTFEVYPTATKRSVSRAVKDLYQVRPVAVRIVRNQPRQTFVRGTRGQVAGLKKAYVTLSKGEKIEAF